MAQARAKELNVREHLGTPTDLGPEATRDISAALSALLADTFALYLKTKNFHWHMSGPHFRDHHLLLDEHGDQIFAMTRRAGQENWWHDDPFDWPHRAPAANQGQRCRLCRPTRHACRAA